MDVRATGYSSWYVVGSLLVFSIIDMVSSLIIAVYPQTILDLPQPYNMAQHSFFLTVS